jgi:hypothetical protein
MLVLKRLVMQRGRHIAAAATAMASAVENFLRAMTNRHHADPSSPARLGLHQNVSHHRCLDTGEQSG